MKTKLLLSIIILFMFSVCVALFAAMFLPQTAAQTDREVSQGKENRIADSGETNITEALSILLQPKNFLYLAGLVATVLGTALAVLVFFVRIGIGPWLQKGFANGTRAGIQELIAKQTGDSSLFSDEAVKQGISNGLSITVGSRLEGPALADSLSRVSEKLMELNETLVIALKRLNLGITVLPTAVTARKTHGYGIEDLIDEIGEDFREDYEELERAQRHDLVIAEQIACKLLERKYAVPDQRRAVIILELTNIYHETKSEEKIARGLDMLNEVKCFELGDDRIVGLVEFMTAVLLKDKQQFDSAWAHAERAKQLFPTNPHILNEFAFLSWRVSEQEGRTDPGLDQLIYLCKEALKFAPRESLVSLQILNNLCYFICMRADAGNRSEIEKRHDIKDALAICDTFRHMESTYAPWLDTQGYCYIVAHRVLGKEYYVLEARKLLEQAVKRDPTNRWAIEHLSQLDSVPEHSKQDPSG